MAVPKDKRNKKKTLKKKYIKRYAELEPRYGKNKFFFGDAYIEDKLGKRFEHEWKDGGLKQIRMHKLKKGGMFNSKSIAKKYFKGGMV
tara:strand:+ start:206 stop:469 length:264 start_codon:yes stop_codon:yes gene_type:complete